jgi:hypothetical protein
VQVDDPPGFRIHLWRDAVGFSPHHVPLLFQVQHPAVERIRVPFIHYDRIASSLAFKDFIVIPPYRVCVALYCNLQADEVDDIRERF